MSFERATTYATSLLKCKLLTFYNSNAEVYFRRMNLLESDYLYMLPKVKN